MFQTETNRRGIMTTLGRGVTAAALISRIDKVAAMQASSASSRALIPAMAYGGLDRPPAPATFDRLPLEWNKRVVALLKMQLGERGIRAFLIREGTNASYLSGYWHIDTERPAAMFMNDDDEHPWYLYPEIDRDLVKGWWWGGGRSYFDFPHAAGAFPNRGVVQTGPAVDLFAYLLEGLGEHGIQGDLIGVDGELTAAEQATATRLLPKVRFVNIGPMIRAMRMVKTPEELQLWSRAYRIADDAHAFARDYILTHGTDITDLEVCYATWFFLLNEMYSGLDLADGAPHHGVASFTNIQCRAGPVNAYPHPNQPYYHKIGRNMPIQLVIVPRVGACGGECYRMLVTAKEGGGYDDGMAHMWEVSRQSCDIQRDLQKDGAVCSDIAAAIFRYQLSEGMKDYIYHRPAHGMNTEGHAPPYIALGDQTVLRRNIIMSQEPGLYDPARGYGFNWSDNIVTGTHSGFRMSAVPYSRQWSFLAL